MVQSVNFPAIFGVFRIITRPRLLVPSCSCIDIRQIDFEQLFIAGYRAVCFDKDNTLTLPYEDTVYGPLQSAFNECKRIFAPNVAVLSNSAGSGDDVGHVAAKELERKLDIAVIRHDHKKPACSKEVMAHFSQIEAGQIVIVGDRLATDVLMANEAGMLSIHTQPLSQKNDNAVAAWFRNRENSLLKHFFGQPYSRPDLQERIIRPK